MSPGRLAPTVALALAAAGTTWLAARDPGPGERPGPAARAAERAAAGPPSAAAAFDFVDPVRPGEDAYQVVLDRPLFFASRRPHDPAAAAPAQASAEASPPEAPAAPAEPPPIRFRVVGALLDGSGGRALVRSLDDGAERWVALGEAHEGWTVAEVAAGAVAVSAGGAVRRLSIYGGGADGRPAGERPRRRARK